MNRHDFSRLSDELGKTVVYMRTVPEAHENGTIEDTALVAFWEAHLVCQKYVELLAQEGEQE